MKRVLVLALLIGASACSHHHKAPDHHHHSATNVKPDDSVAFDGNCPYAVMEGDLHTHGKEEFKLEHGGETYYFSSQDKLEKFKKDLPKNLSAARKKWKRGMAR